MKKKHLIKAFLIAILVGSLLNIINNYEVFLKEAFTYKAVAKIILTYITPFCVSLYSSISAAKLSVTN